MRKGNASRFETAWDLNCHDIVHHNPRTVRKCKRIAHHMERRENNKKVLDTIEEECYNDSCKEDETKCQ